MDDAQSTVPTQGTAAPDPHLSALIESQVRGLTAYRREVLLYPEGHPRLSTRLNALYGELSSFLDGRRTPLHLQVRDRTLYSDDAPVAAESAAVRDLASILRERMVQLVKIDPGVEVAEIEAFVRFLLDEPAKGAHARAERASQLGSHISLYFFNTTFGNAETVASQQQIVSGDDDGGGDGDGDAGGDGDASGAALDLEAWNGFDGTQLESIEHVLQDQSLRSRLNEVRETIGVSADGRQFLQAFFETLRRDPRTKWDDLAGLTERVHSGLSLLQDAKRAEGISKTIPVHLLAPETEANDQITTHLRWLLIRNFFPGRHMEESPRLAEDIAAQSNEEVERARKQDALNWQLSGGGWCLTEVPSEDWGKTEPEACVADWRNQFQTRGLIEEFTAVTAELVKSAPSQTGSLDAYLRAVQKGLGGAPSVEDLSAILRRLDELPPEPRWVWRQKLLALGVDPAHLLDLLAHGDEKLRQGILSEAVDIDSTATASDSPIAAAHDALRTQLVARDRRSLDLLYALFRAGAALGGERGWGPLVRRVASETGADVEAWFADHGAELLEPAGIPFLLCLPADPIAGPLRIALAGRRAHELRRCLEALARHGRPEALPHLILGLDLEEPAARHAAVRALGLHGTARALQVLIDLLQHANDLEYDADMVEAVVSAIGAMPLPEATAFLSGVLTERKGMIFSRWKRGIRQSVERWKNSATRKEQP